MKYNTSNSFTDMNVDPIKGTEIMGLLNADAIDLQTPKRFSRLQDIINYFQDKGNAAFVIRKLTTDKTKDPIDHVWSYVMVAKEYDDLKEDIDEMDNSESEQEDDEYSPKKLKEMKAQLKMLEEELKFFDK